MAAERLLESMAVRLTGDGSGYQTMISSAVRATNKFAENVSAKMVSVGMAMSMTFSRLGQWGKEIAALGMDFELEMSRIEGLVGASRRQMDEYKDAVVAMAPAMGKTPKELASALYYITSAGFEGAEALDVLRQSAMASVAGLGQTQTVADAVTTAVTAYGKENLSARQAVDILTAAVRVGKAEATSFADAMGRVIPIAASMGVSFGEVAGAMAVMSKAGLDAFESGTALRGLLTVVQRPAQQSREVLRMVGITAGELRNIVSKPGGTVEALRMLKEAFGDATSLMEQVIPNVRASTGAWNLLSQNAKDVDRAMREVREASDDLRRAFEITNRTAQQQLNVALSNMRSELVRLGEAAAQTVVPALLFVSEQIGKLYKWLNELDPAIKATAAGLGYIVSAAGPLLITLGLLVPLISSGITSLIAFAVAIKNVGAAMVAAQLSGGWMLILAAVAAAGYGIVKLTNNLTGLTEKVKAHKKAMDELSMGTSQWAAQEALKTDKIIGGIQGESDPNKRREAIAREAKAVADEVAKIDQVRKMYESKVKEGPRTRTGKLGSFLETVGIVSDPGVEQREIQRYQQLADRYAAVANKLQQRAGKLKEELDNLDKEAKKPKKSTDIFAEDFMRMRHTIKDQIEEIGRTMEEVQLRRLIKDGLDTMKRWQLEEDIVGLHTAKLTEEINQQSAALVDQIATFDMSAVAAARYNAAIKGASENEIKDIERLTAMSEAMKTERQFESPSVTLARRMEELNEQYTKGQLSAEAYARAVNSARKNVEGLTNAITALDPRGAEFISLLIEQARDRSVNLPPRYGGGRAGRGGGGAGEVGGWLNGLFPPMPAPAPGAPNPANPYAVGPGSAPPALPGMGDGAKIEGLLGDILEENKKANAKTGNSVRVFAIDIDV